MLKEIQDKSLQNDQIQMIIQENEKLKQIILQY